MQKQQRFRHWVNSEGHLDVRIATEYITDEGEVILEELGPSINKPALTPADVKDMKDWDDKSKEIVEAITDTKVIADHEAEKLELIVRGKTYKHPLQITRVGIEETCIHDFEIEEDGRIRGRYTFKLFDEGMIKKKRYLRYEVQPGEINSGRVRPSMTRAVAKKLHTPEVITAYKAKLAEQAQ